MSIAVMAYVWEHSAQRGTDLTLILAIADFANEDGIAWPAIETLARRIRSDERTAQRAARRLQKAGELRIQAGAGPRGTHLYQVLMNRTLPLFAEQHWGGNLPPVKLPGVAPRAKRGDTAVPPEPSRTVIEKPSTGASPVAVAFKDYADGIHQRYRVNYPQSAQANGILAGLVRELGAEGARATIRHYLTRSDEFYVRNRHSLKLLKRDAGALFIQAQETGSSGRRRCAYCEAPAIGRTGSIDHCRAHTNDALDQKPVQERQAA